MSESSETLATVDEHDGTVAVPAAAPTTAAPEAHSHTSPAQYVLVAVVLCIVTGFEIATSYLDIDSWIIITLLVVFASIKFYLVAAFFMHLRSDRPIFRRFFALGLSAAIALYIIVLLTLHVALDV